VSLPSNNDLPPLLPFRKIVFCYVLLIEDHELNAFLVSPTAIFWGCKKNVCTGLIQTWLQGKVSRAVGGFEGGALILPVTNLPITYFSQIWLVESASSNRPDFRSRHSLLCKRGWVTLIFSQKCMDSRRFHNGKTNIWTWEDRSINLEGRVSYQERKFRFALKSK